MDSSITKLEHVTRWFEIAKIGVEEGVHIGSRIRVSFLFVSWSSVIGGWVTGWQPWDQHYPFIFLIRNNRGSKSAMRNVIKIHSNAMWEWRYLTEYIRIFSHSILHVENIHECHVEHLSIPQNVVMNLNNVVWNLCYHTVQFGWGLLFVPQVKVKGRA